MPANGRDGRPAPTPILHAAGPTRMSATTTLNRSVLVLNQNYEPLHVCNVRRAVVLVARGKAEIIDKASQLLRSALREFAVPSVIRMVYFIRRPRPVARLSRREVFARDRHTCQYCGKRSGDLTLDHVLPRARGGQHTWENLVSACRGCNHRKAGRTPREARMRLLSEPRRPRVTPAHLFGHYVDRQPGWRPFIPGLDQPDPRHDAHLEAAAGA